MKLLQIIFVFAFLFINLSAIAQREQAPNPEKAPVNQYDAKGRKQGMWWISMPSHMGEPAATEFGTYNHGDKNGVWYKVDEKGDLMAIESYRNNVLDGEVKYYEDGQLYCLGHYRGLNARKQYDTIVIEDPITHLESYKVISTDAGTMRHGSWRYYNPQTGHLIKEEEYQVDDLIFKKEYDVSSKADSIYRKHHESQMPHNKGVKYNPPAGKKLSYTN